MTDSDQQNITSTAASGFDLYAQTDAGRWQGLSIGKPTKFPEAFDVLAARLPTAPAAGRGLVLYLPLRNGVTSLEIGVSPCATVTPSPARPTGRKPLAFCGMSITHGSSASRPGMTHPAILGRAFNREIINLGFSGNGKMEPEVTRFFAELNPAVFILDCLPKMNDTEVHERTAHRQRNESNHAALGEEFAKLQAEKVPQLYYLKADNLLSSDGEGPIHSSHPTDLGFTRQAAEVERVLRQIPSLA